MKAATGSTVCTHIKSRQKFAPVSFSLYFPFEKQSLLENEIGHEN